MERPGPQGVGVDRRAQQGEDEVCPTLLAPTASLGSPLTSSGSPSPPLEAPPHLSLETLHQDGHQQVEEHVVAKGHEGHEVQGGPGGRGGHAVVQDDVPVLLGPGRGRSLPSRAGAGSTPRAFPLRVIRGRAAPAPRAHLKMKMKSMSSMQKVATLSMVFMSTTSWRRSAGMKRTSLSTRSSRKERHPGATAASAQPQLEAGSSSTSF
ncbi:hypothetical protein FD754_016369 [Muntiacus muntjak]|uniref:Uncharacterized protein n=1 Tax=Muntiacus muntjak TaxID=9888 RepID=A0A5N3VQW1_MUNMU|nr:hypothetical protein FD754_016369 [Muntiacus muntjak]